MLKHVIVLLFLYGIKGDSNQETDTAKTENISGIKKNEVGANGLDKSEEIIKNFRNPVLEYLLNKNPQRTNEGPRKGIVREIRHSQTLLIPNFHILSPNILNQWPSYQNQMKPTINEIKNTRTPMDNFWNFLKNKTGTENKTHESVVTSPVLHLNKNDDQESIKIQMYPATAIIINTYNKDGTLKNSVTHFQPDFNSIKPGTRRNEEIFMGDHIENYKSAPTAHHTINNYLGENQRELLRPTSRQQGTIPWPFANYFPIVINDPFNAVVNAVSASMYNAVSSMVEYGPQADICSKGAESTNKKPELNQYQRKEVEEDPNLFAEMTMRSDAFGKDNKPLRIEAMKQGLKRLITSARKRRDTTNIFLKTKQGDSINIGLKETVGAINRTNPDGSDLILRKGGIAIAGPGGAATAYTGGTAIVGPYGTVYKSPAGIAILGPFARIVNITDDTSFEEILKMHRELQTGTIEPTTRNQIPKQPKLNFKTFRNLFSYITDLPIKIELKSQKRNFRDNHSNVVRLREGDIVKTIEEIRKGEFRRIVEDSPFEEKMVKDNETTLIFRPKSKAEAGRNGVALSAPTSHAILYPGQKANIYFEPESVASAGPSGFAHAHSDLFVSYMTTTTTTAEPPVSEPNARKINIVPSIQDERARSFSQILVNLPPLSTILRPPHSESRQFLGYAEKKKKVKPSKPIKEEASSEEVGEEHEEENPNEGQENANEAVAISPPPDGASVAEAKPVGLAIAGPGGVAASKPQGTAVAGPGGLAIARPVGTAIAGVEVEGSVPIGGTQKNKKKPKQEQEQTDTELHYVGGLTGPIGNPQPKEFADSLYYKSRQSEGNNIRENLSFRGRNDANGYQLKLGQHDGKYGFVPMFTSPIQSSERLQKRMDSQTFFHGLLGTNDQEQLQNYQFQFQ